MRDLTGDGLNELVVESDYGWAGSAAISLQVFNLSHGHFDECLRTNSRLEYEIQESYTQTLDIGRTLQGRGRRFCCSKTIRVRKGRWLSPPRVVHPCYERGYGVDPGAGRWPGPP